MKKENLLDKVELKLRTLEEKALSSDDYRSWAVRHAHQISDEALISLFGCRGFHEIKAEAEALTAEESNIVETPLDIAPAPKFDKNAYQAKFMRDKRVREKAERDAQRKAKS